ncbi:MAG: Hsp20/alpha crystallin family protein [Anaerolineales bacterium]|nr:Hsp20/alpha crystallin family protein [Anaerolineales bacterium]
MSLTIRPYYRPSPMARMMDRWFEEALAPLSERFSEDTLSLPMDVQATERGYTVSASVPGLKAEDLTIEVLGNTVSIRGEVKSEPATETDGDWLVRERTYGKFARTFRLPAELDSEKVEASLEAGILTVRLPKAESARPKAISIKVK